MKVECAHDKLMPTKLLMPHPQNANKHTDEQIKLLAKILEYQGWRHPIVISKRSGYIVAGHGRLSAAQLNNWPEVPVDEQDFENEAQELLYLVSDNKIAELSESDPLKIEEIAKGLGDFDFDLTGIPNFYISNTENHDLDEKDKMDSQQSFKVEVTCVNGQEMTDLTNELLERGMIAKAIFKDG